MKLHQSRFSKTRTGTISDRVKLWCKVVHWSKDDQEPQILNLLSILVGSQLFASLRARDGRNLSPFCCGQSSDHRTVKLRLT